MEVLIALVQLWHIVPPPTDDWLPVEESSNCRVNTFEGEGGQVQAAGGTTGKGIENYEYKIV